MHFVGEARIIVDKQTRCYFCDPKLQRDDGSLALKPWVIGALAELFVFSKHIYDVALQRTARSDEELLTIRRQVQRRLESLNPIGMPIRARQLRIARAVEAVDAVLGQHVHAPSVRDQIKAIGTQLVRLQPLSKVSEELPHLVHVYLIDSAKILHTLYVICSEVLRDGYSIARQPVFDIDEHLCSGTEKILSHSYCCARLLHNTRPAFGMGAPCM